MTIKTFDEVRKEAIEKGIEPNNVSVGIWAKMEGYIKKRKVVKGKVNYFYQKPEIKNQIEINN